jgi:D-alanyl-lipoteichoic acid acyltransferase DltB (MBOAT superfamily)
MLFNSLQFLVFFALVFCVHRMLAPSWRIGWLLAASVVFYAMWAPIYLLLLLFVVGVNYLLVRRMPYSGYARLYLAAAVAFTLSVLAFFKYAGFFVETANTLASCFGAAPRPIPDVLLPLGISFYSFEVIALAVDIYRGEMAPPRRFRDYLFFTIFFPHLIAGPILRGYEFLPQLPNGGQVTADRNRRGLWLLATGLFKKVVLGDFLLAPMVTEIFAYPGLASGPVHLVGMYSFAFQIYYDFSGYSDMARGIACILGFDLPLNFAEPYLSRNPVEFWRRWHMTLSRWLRDYLYIPLGGNRKGPVMTYVNLALTMLLGGLWHGAAWQFVAWGGLHGIWLAFHRYFMRREDTVSTPPRWRDAWRILLTFHAVCVFWVFFRAETFGDAVAFLGRIFALDYLQPWPVLPTLVVVVCAVLHLIERTIRERWSQVRALLGTGLAGALVEGLAWGVCLALTIAASGTGAEFIYFQF